MNRHLNDHQLLAYLEGELSPDSREQVKTHLHACLVCRTRVDRLSQNIETLTATLDAASQQVKLSPRRSWAALAQRREEQSKSPFGPLLRPRLRHAAVLATLGILIVGLAGLVHTLAITSLVPVEATPVPDVKPTASASSVPGPLPSRHSDGPVTPIACLILGADGENASSSDVDSLMLLYLDNNAERAFLLSIPRDLYVELPGRGQTRAGSVYKAGEQDEATDGLTLARETISATLDFPIQHAVLVRFDGFITLVDAVGGLEIEVPHLIDDAKFPDNQRGYDPLVIPAGQHRFDGAIALRYARTRVEPVPGFDRAFRQRQIVLAAYQRVSQPGVLSNLLPQAASLWTAVASAVETDLSLNAIIDLALLAPDLNADDITTANLEACCTRSHSTSTDELVLLSQPEQVETLIHSLLEE
jgi:LCP family protein required for cell wall assembly